MADKLATRAIPAFLRSLADATEQASNLESIATHLVEEILAIKENIDNFVIKHRRIKNEWQLSEKELTVFLTFIEEKIYKRTSTTTRLRTVVKELQEHLKRLEESLRKLADAIDDEAAKESSNTTRTIIVGGIAFVSLIFTLFTGNAALITLTGGCGFFCAYSTYVECVPKKEREEISSNVQTLREKLVEEKAKLCTEVWTDELSHPEN